MDVHKHQLTAVAVDGLGRVVAERTGPVEGDLIGWARVLGEERVWAIEDCRHVTRSLEQLVAAREQLVRVPPRLTAPQRRRGRSRGKSGRVHPPARAYLERKQAEGKTRREAIRCLKRQLARTVYTALRNDPLLT